MLSPNEVFLNQDGIIEIKVVGDQTAASVREMGKVISQLAEECRDRKQPVVILDDLRQMGAVPPEGRKTVVELGKTLDYDKIAMVGNGSVLRLGANLMLRATGKSHKVKYFEDYALAVTWLLR